MSDPLVIGTRGSRLALWQAEWVAERLGGSDAGVRLEVIRTEGDRAIDLDLAGTLERGLFTRDIEVALLERRVDVAVHSLKDLPTKLPEGLTLAAVPERAPAGDVLLVHPDALAEGAAVPGALPLAAGARVGTSSPRRQALLRLACGAATTVPIRGNLPTRVAKCVGRDVDAIVLARAGLERLRLDVAPLVAFDLAPEAWLPAPAQGALGLEARAADERVLERLRTVNEPATAALVGVERRLLARLEAGCHAALGAWAQRAGDATRLLAGALGADDAWRAVEVVGTPDDVVERAALALTESVPTAQRDVGWASPAVPWT